MGWEKIESHWEEYAVSARAHWSKLNEDDWQAITGTKGHLIGRIQKRYGIARAAAEKQVDEWSDGQIDIIGDCASHSRKDGCS